MNTRDILLVVFISLTVILAVVTAIEINQVNLLSSNKGTSSSSYCVQTGVHGTLLVRVLQDGSGQPVQNASVTVVILNYCQTPAWALDPMETNSTGYTGGVSWTGNFTVSVVAEGRSYYFLAWTGAGVNVATLSIPSGTANITEVECTGFGCPSV